MDRRRRHRASLAGGQPVGALAPPSVASPAVTTVPVRDDLRALEGYHSPQVAVRVRLNTNESPDAATGGVARRARRRGLAGRLAPLSRPRAPASCATRSAQRTALGPTRSSSPTDRTRCCRRCCSRMPAPVAPSPRSSRRTSCTGTSPGSAGRPWSKASAAADFRLDLGEVERVLAAARPIVTFLCSPNNPTGLVEPAATCGRARRGRRASWSSTRRTASSPRGRRSTSSTRIAHSSSRGPSPRRGRWPRPDSATSSGRRGWWPSSRRWCCRTTSTRPSRSPAAWRCATSTRWRSGCSR